MYLKYLGMEVHDEDCTCNGCQLWTGPKDESFVHAVAVFRTTEDGLGGDPKKILETVYGVTAESAYQLAQKRAGELGRQMGLEPNTTDQFVLVGFHGPSGGLHRAVGPFHDSDVAIARARQLFPHGWWTVVRLYRPDEIGGGDEQ